MNVKLDPLVQLLPPSHFLTCFLNSFMTVTATYFVLHFWGNANYHFPKWEQICISTHSKNDILWGNFWGLLIKLHETKTRSLQPQFLKNMELFRDYAFVLQPVIADESECTSIIHYNQLLLFVFMSSCKNMIWHVQFAPVIVHFLMWPFLTPKI